MTQQTLGKMDQEPQDEPLEHLDAGILERYNRPAPRYTSYPTAPDWHDTSGPAQYESALKDCASKPVSSPLSLYFHLPFCRSLCLFCGCNVVISKSPDVVGPYVDRLKREIDWISGRIGHGRPVEQLHWGGGTPTFLSPDQIEDLYTYIRERFTISKTAEISVEIEPRVTTPEHCRRLRAVGFNRVSLGIQDFDPIVQKAVRRIQPFELTRTLFNFCRESGFDSINVDLIYGLPHQTVESFALTVEQILWLNPDRIALFSYAHVPWLKKQQGSFAGSIPQPAEKFQIFCRAASMFQAAGYRFIGMDHFARPDDEICRAQDDRTLHRNFQGFTTRAGCDLLGMGVSAISAVDDVYSQNWRGLPDYYRAIDSGSLPTMRGIKASGQDRLRREIINRILCHAVLVKSEIESLYGVDFDRDFAHELEELEQLERDGLVILAPDRIELTPLGRVFARNAAMIFDYRLRKGNTSKQFSASI